jgi:hypothetical protein
MARRARARVIRALLVSAGVIAAVGIAAVVSDAQAVASSAGSASSTAVTVAGTDTSPSAPCVVSLNAPQCQSTDPDLTVDAAFYGDTSGCTFTSSIVWGDGSVAQQVTVGGQPQPGEGFMADHTYQATQTQTYSITASAVSVTGGCYIIPGSYTFTLDVGSPPVFTVDTPPDTAPLDAAYSYTFVATGSPTPSYSVLSGSLPDGLSLNSTTGLLSGILADAGTFTFKVSATDGVNPAAVTLDITITVSPGRVRPRSGHLPGPHITPLRMYNDTFWVAVSAAAPVIALAVVVAYNNMRREKALYMREIEPSGGLSIWRYEPALGGPKAARIARRWSWTAVSVHRLNVLGQATVLAFSLTSLAQQVNEMSLALAIVAELGGLLALLAAGMASKRMLEILFQVALFKSRRRDDV